MRQMQLSREVKTTIEIKKLYGGKLRDITTYTRNDADTGIDVVTHISYGNPYIAVKRAARKANNPPLCASPAQYRDRGLPAVCRSRERLR
jgi:hypothetical protein